MDNNYSNIVTVKFAQAEQPKFEEKKGKGFIEFGKENNYPEYLMGLFHESPKHGAIIRGKANYIFGKGFENLNQPANSKGETFNQVAKKAILDDEIYAGYYLMVIYNLLGKIKDIYHLAYHKVRTNKDCSKFFIKDDWNDNKEQMRTYPAFNGQYEKDSPTKIIFVKQYNTKSEVYPLPSYFHGLNYIESDVQVSRHILGNAKDGFVATTLISLNGGEPQEEHKAAVERGLKKKFTGSEGDRVVIMFNKSKDNEATISPLSSTMLTKEDFTNINNLITQEIFAAHQVTSPTLFGISTPGALGQRNEMRDAYEIFNNTYVNERQQQHEEVFNKLFGYIGIQGQYKIVPVEPLGFAVNESIMAEILPREYFFEKLNVDQKYWNLPPVKDANNMPAPSGAVGMEVNKNLAAMSGKQFQHLERVVRKFKKGSITRGQAEMMLKNSFGLAAEDIAVMLDTDSEDAQFASQEEMDFALIEQFSQFGEDESDFEVVSSKPARESEYFADVKQLTELEANVLNLIKKDNKVTAEVIADTLRADLKTVEKIMQSLESAGILTAKTSKIGQDTIIERTVTDVKVGGEKPTTTSILLRYKYSWRTDLTAAEIESGKQGSRPFCQKMMDLKRLYSRADIENISLRLGYSAWDRVGGWWTREDGSHSPQCRHTWNALTVIRKK